MQRIGIDIRPLREARRDGVPTYAAEMIRVLAARGDRDYTLFANGWRLPGRGLAALPNDVPPSSEHLRYRLTGYPSKVLNAGFMLGAVRAEQLIGDVDALWLPNLIFMSTRKPVVVTVHDLSFVRAPHFFTAKHRVWHAMIGVRRLLRSAAAVTTVSANTKADVMELYGVPAERITVVPPGVAPRFIPQSETEITRVRARYGLSAPFFLYLGTIEPRKNVAGVIAAYDACRADADLVIAGGKGWMHQEVFAAAARARKRDRIRFLEYVPEEDKPGLYSAASAFVYPSFYEGFGMPVAEAMACGTPVIASRGGALSKTVSDAGILVDPYDHAELARAMDAIISDAALRERLRAAGRARAAGFTWERSAELMAGVFDRI